MLFLSHTRGLTVAPSMLFEREGVKQCLPHMRAHRECHELIQLVLLANVKSVLSECVDHSYSSTQSETHGATIIRRPARIRLHHSVTFPIAFG